MKKLRMTSERPIMDTINKNQLILNFTGFTGFASEQSFFVLTISRLLSFCNNLTAKNEKVKA